MRGSITNIIPIRLRPTRWPLASHTAGRRGRLGKGLTMKTRPVKYSLVPEPTAEIVAARIFSTIEGYRSAGWSDKDCIEVLQHICRQYLKNAEAERKAQLEAGGGK